MGNLIISILVCLSFIGCSDKDGLLSPTEMKEDIRFYFHMIRDIHPDPYQRYDSLTFVRLEAEMIESCSEPMAREDFGFRLMKTRKFLDGHVGVFDFFSLPGRYHFPSVEFQGDLMLLGNDTLLAVRDSFASYTALDVDSMIPWDQPSKIRNENMNLLLNLLLSPANKSTMTYTGVLKTANGTRDTLIYVDTRRVKKNPIYTQPYSSKFYPEDSIAVLYYNSCMIYGEEDVKHYEGYVNAFFDELKSKKIKTLFIDVTHNGGGSDGNNSVIINHLKADAFTSKVRMTGKRAGIEEYLKSDLVKKFFNENETTKNYWLETFGNPIMEKGVAVLEESAPARESGYEGNVFVIMGNRTYSAGADFCLSIKAFKAATLVGEKAGQYYPICGNAIRGTLPNSKVMYQIPSTEAFYEPETLFENGYICPDISYPLKEEMGVEDYKEILSFSSIP
ncbi:hypothetical protein H8S77_01420 [Parabacteroides sp. BX2]|jgi:hypothetical protein|uniref:Tail specific protease domain-containing protein n=1 Tax=Parabacteroides segnis TaxID=2763058 RepID=A0ABR7DVJ6_9BACT|nr:MULTISPECIES: S41 family peptidase [Parabacteroides]MBC5641549.1 hypothetical protein [Parabacteroides segnis]MCM0711298.1 S41 family peptidase [Parabacteroides sp. TA-V-105]